jgi:hypothetical protein
LAWKFFGKTLLVSHLAVLPFLLGIAWEYYKLAKKFLPAYLIPFALLLLISEPTVTSQSIFMSYDISKAYFFLLALNALMQKEKILFLISIGLLSLCSIRGIFLSGSIFLIHIFLSKQNKHRYFVKEILWYLPAIALMLAWSAYHYYKTGWWFFSSAESYLGERNFLPPAQILRQIFALFWHLFDFGRIFIWLLIIVAIFYLRKPTIQDEKLRTLFLITTIPLAIFIITICPFSIPVGHKYFIVLFILTLILVLYLLDKIWSNRKTIYAVALFFSAALITGNFWIYGNDLSNGWDSSLKSLPYFKLRDEMVQFVNQKKINPADVGTKFPLYHNLKYADLKPYDFSFADLYGCSLERFRYVLLSNISNQFTLTEKKKLDNNWILVKEYKSGQVYLKLYQNPDLQ